MKKLLNYYIIRLIGYFLICCWSITLSSQTQMLDSLFNVLDSHESNTQERGYVLLEISRQYQVIDTSKTRHYILEVQNLAINKGYKDLERDTYWAMAFFSSQYANQPYLSYINYKKAEKIIYEQNDMTRIGKLYNNLMCLFYDIGDFENTDYYANKILELNDSLIDSQVLSTIQFAAELHKGYIKFQNVESEESLAFFVGLDKKLKEMQIQSQYNRVVAYRLANLYLSRERPREALKHLYEIRTSYERLLSTSFLYTGYPQIAEAYVLLNMVDSADVFVDKARNVNYLWINDKLALYQTLSKLSYLKGNYNAAFDSYYQFHHMSDSFFNAEKTIEIARMKNWQELEQKDKENEILQIESQKQQKLLLLLSWGLFIIMSLLVISIIFYRKSIKQNSELKKMHSLKDKIFSIVSHDLRSPINSLANTLKLANTLTINTENKARILKNVSSNVDNAYALIDNLLLWSKNQIKEIMPVSENFNIQSEIRMILDDLIIFAEEKFIDIENNTQIHSLNADKEMFKVIMRNLITNAIKYSHSKGKIVVNSEISDNNLIISVKDTGIGMTQAIQDTLFKLSETKSTSGTNNETGTGLGLVLCTEFAKKMRGNIGFTSKEGKGSTFFLSLPNE